ncbi:MAG: hypothetical protein JJE09_07975 [Bacteroidia bacterium]|nr:hypothetical protein [Bacteroidia bacterium]
MNSLSKIRRFCAFLFEVISIFIIVVYANPEFLRRHQSSKSHQTFLQSNSGNPIVYHKASEYLTYTNSSSGIQLAGYPSWDVNFDLPALEIETNESLFVVVSLYNVFYVITSINAP